MAAVIVFRNHLINNLQLPAAVVSQIIDIHGYDSVEEFATATDREIRDLIATIRKTPSIPNDSSSPKIVLGQTFAIRILHFMYYSRLIQKVGRQHTIGPGTQATSSIANIRTIGRYFERIGDHDESDSPDYPSAYDGKNSRTLLEDIDSWLSRTYGRGNILLSYVTRVYADPNLNPEGDPGFLQPDVENELIRRASMFDDDFNENNKRVWLMLRAVTHKTDAWQIIKGVSRSQNGRQAYLALISHFKGRGHVSRIKTDARNVLERIFWKGTSRGFTFDTFVSRLQGAYHDLAEYGDVRTDESKVDMLLTKVSGDSSLSSACTFIRNDPDLSADFIAAIQYLSNEVLARSRTMATNPTRNISATSRRESPRQKSRNSRDNNNAIGNSNDRFSKEGNIILNDGTYSNHIWWNVFNEDERRYCESLRQRRRNKRRNSQRNVSTIETKNSKDDTKPAANAGNGMSRRRHTRE